MLLYAAIVVLALSLLWLVFTDPYVVTKVESTWSKITKYWTSFQKFSANKRRIVLLILVVIFVAIIVYAYFKYV